MIIDFKKKKLKLKKNEGKRKKKNCLSDCELDIHRSVFVPTLE